MIFQHTIDAVLNGTKTQTSRIVKHTDVVTWVKPGELYRHRVEDLPTWDVDVSSMNKAIMCVSCNNRQLWRVGNTYAVQPGRGQKAVARIRILQIRLMDVRYISAQDAVDEGFIDIYEFLKVWCKMHDPVGYKVVKPITSLYTVLPRIPLLDRPAERYRAWVISFKLEED
jgi:hypothetical protein